MWITSSKPIRLLPARPFFLLALLLCIGLAPGRAAFADATTEAQLRAALQQATTQIAQLQDQLANLQAEQAPSAALINTLQAKLQTLAKNGVGATETAADKAKNDAALTALNRQLAAQSATLNKTQSAYSQAAGAANAAAAANTQLTAQMTALNGQVNSCDTKNAALFALGNQILDAYSHKNDPLAMFANHEPFIGFARVKLQNIVQDDQDKLNENKINPPQANP
jgi:colicin import membrane protein